VRELRGRNALVTGAGGGLGRHIARSLAAVGVNLAVTDLPGVDLEPLRGELRVHGARCEAVPADLTDLAGLGGLREAAEEAVGPIDLLVNNAGIGVARPVEAHPDGELERIVTVNLLAAMELTRLSLPGMLERRRGHVVNVASLAGRAAIPYFSAYCATKFGLVGFTLSLRAEHHGGPVGFSVICPGFVGSVGLLARFKEKGAAQRVPILGEMPPERVGEAVVRAVRRDIPEVIVNRRPMRPLAVLAAASPRMMERLANMRGLRRFADELAEAERQQARTKPPTR
jgi:short-subunit dehydrogenase